jgi:hypothetical protein
MSSFHVEDPGSIPGHKFVAGSFTGISSFLLQSLFSLYSELVYSGICYATAHGTPLYKTKDSLIMKSHCN